jgi:putative oxidoreductase
MMAGYAQSKGVPSAKAAVSGSGMLLGIGGLSILFNVYLTIGLIAPVLFLIPVTLMMHAFWKNQDPGARTGETVNFAKEIVLLGAVFIMPARVKTQKQKSV